VTFFATINILKTRASCMLEVLNMSGSIPVPSKKMSLIQYEYLSRSDIKITYLAYRNLPRVEAEIFIRCFIEEKLSVSFLSLKHASLIGSSVIGDLVDDDLAVDMLMSWSGVRFIVEVYYFDSENMDEKSTEFAFRLGSYIDFSEISLLDTEKGICFENIAEKLCEDMFLVYSTFLEDPHFRTDKLVLNICFEPLQTDDLTVGGTSSDFSDRL